MTGTLQNWLGERLLQFRDDTRGVTAILFAAVALPVLGLGLAAIDYARAHGSKAAIQDAADSAAHAGAKMLGGSHDEIEDAVRGYLRTNLPKDRAELPFSLTFGPDDSSLTVKMKTTVPTSMLSIVGLKDFSVAVESTAGRPDPIKEMKAPHKGVMPELPPEIAKQLPGLEKQLSSSELRQAEDIARQLIGEIERNGGSAELQQLMRGLQNLR